MMNQQEIEVILARQLADYLALPIFLVDQEGNLLFYNEPAEKILGHRYEETGPMPALEWGTVFLPTDEDGHPLPADRLPLMVALQDARPAHSGFWIRGLDGVLRQIEVIAFPLIGQSDRRLGAMAVFWERPA
jgi:PAS domain S-box-containing protein